MTLLRRYHNGTCCRCGVALRDDWKASACTPCHAVRVKEWRAGLTMGPTRRFPGVDIDAIHYKLGAVKKKEAA